MNEIITCRTESIIIDEIVSGEEIDNFNTFILRTSFHATEV